jgi:multidrug resistance efflux pump
MKISLGIGKSNKSPIKNDIAIEYAPQKRVFPWIRWWLVILLITSPLLFFIYNLLAGIIIIDSPAVVLVQRAFVTMPKDGFIETLSADVALPVTKGDAIMKVLPASWKDDTRNLELLKERATNFEKLEPPAPVEPPPPPTVSDENIRLARASVSYWHKNRQIYEDLKKKGAATDAEYRDALERENAARNALAQLQQVSPPVSPPPPRENSSVLLEHLQIDKEIILLEERIAGELVRSPISGRISRVLSNEGQTLPLGEAVVEIINDERVRMLVYVDEKIMDYVYSKSQINVELPGNVNITCELANMPLQTGMMPPNMTRAFASNRAVLVELKPVDRLPDEYLVDGLPVTVHWGIWKPKIFSRLPFLKNIFSPGGD